VVQVGTRTRSGWVTLSAVLITLAGAYNVIWGLSALNKKELFHEESLVYSNLQFWAWLFLIVGALQLLTAVLLFMRNVVGAFMAVVGASTSAFLAIFSIVSTPGWSLVIIALDLLILWGVLSRYDEDFG